MARHRAHSEQDSGLNLQGLKLLAPAVFSSFLEWVSTIFFRRLQSEDAIVLVKIMLLINFGR